MFAVIKHVRLALDHELHNALLALKIIQFKINYVNIVKITKCVKKILFIQKKNKNALN